MSEKALNEINTEDIASIKLVDNQTGNTLSGSLIGAEKNNHELTLFVDSGME